MNHAGFNLGLPKLKLDIYVSTVYLKVFPFRAEVLAEQRGKPWAKYVLE